MFMPKYNQRILMHNYICDTMQYLFFEVCCLFKNFVSNVCNNSNTDRIIEGNKQYLICCVFNIYDILYNNINKKNYVMLYHIKLPF